MKSLYALILVGGAGTRLWPWSRQSTPKQFMRVGGEWSLFQETVLRLSGRVEPGRMIFVTARDLEHDVRDQLRRLLGSRSGDCIIAGEPAARNTAPAILLGTRIVQAMDADALVLAAPSDHVIHDADSFLEAIDLSIEAALSGRIVTYGINPTRAETGYGYIRAGRREGKVHAVEGFEEKPTSGRAEELYRDDRYTWNSGIFLFAVRTLMEEAEKHLPAHYKAIMEVDPRNLRGLEESYREMEPVSIDVGIMEKTSRAGVIPVSMGWSDLGSWDSYYESSDKDSSGNVVTGDVLSLDNEGCLLLGGERFLAASGMKDVIVVQTEDATLICPRGRSQDVRLIVDHLEDQDRTERLVHRTTSRPWGSFSVLEEAPSFKVKRIVIEPGHKLSLQMHRQRGEHWVIAEGEGVVTIGEEEIPVEPQKKLYIPAGTRHRAENTGSGPMIIVEVQFGSYLGEDDIIRFEDDYGRETES